MEQGDTATKRANMTDSRETSYLNFAWGFSIHETAAVHLYCCRHTDSTVLFHTSTSAIQYSERLHGFRSGL